MADEATRKMAADWAMEAFNDACEEAEARPAVGSMCSHDIARLALDAKNEAEARYSVRLTAMLDDDWNWHFA